MYICICNAITEQQVHQAIDGGAESLWDLQATLGVAGGCGSCGETAAEILQERRAGQRLGEPRMYVPSVA